MVEALTRVVDLGAAVPQPTAITAMQTAGCFRRLSLSLTPIFGKTPSLYTRRVLGFFQKWTTRSGWTRHYVATSSRQVMADCPTDGTCRRIAETTLPGVGYRRHLFWRYSLVWTKPGR